MTRSVRSRHFAAAFVSLLGAGPLCAGDNLIDALKGGKVDLYLRYRFEFVDDDQPRIIAGTPPTLSAIPLQDAKASTLRTALGYSSGLFYDFGFYVQLEDVRVIGDDAYNNGGENGVIDHAAVVDPEGTEVNQANLRYAGLPYTTLKLGRQEIEHRQAPLHRYIGNILWRQNWQSFDGFRALNEYLPATVIDYAYVWNTNRIFGEDNEIPDRSDFRMDSHFINLQYTGFHYGKFEPYAYLLDFESLASEGFSTATYGLRFQGGYDIITYPVKILYTGEYAHQTDYAENPADIDADYYLGELGGTYTFVDKPIEFITVKGSYEVLEGDGPEPVSGCCGGRVARAFQTPLGTNHAFQGWADRFLITPADGIEDLFVTLQMKVWGANFIAMWHDFSANDEDYDYGTEWDLLLERPIGNNFLVGIKYSYYDASGDALNQARNSISGQAFDLEKAWAYVQFKF
ncbi:MAG: alginate export family protein [Gammaproteobacteria bacterium]